MSLIGDVQGYFYSGAISGPAMLPFVPLTAVRVADTRTGQPVGPAGQLRVKVAGVGGVPTGVKAVLVNLTGTRASTSTWLTAYADGTAPGTSNIDLVPGQTRPILVTVPVDSTGYITISNARGTADVIVDLAGYYSN